MRVEQSKMSCLTLVINFHMRANCLETQVAHCFVFLVMRTASASAPHLFIFNIHMYVCRRCTHRSLISSKSQAHAFHANLFVRRSTGCCVRGWVCYKQHRVLSGLISTATPSTTEQRPHISTRTLVFYLYFSLVISRLKSPEQCKTAGATHDKMRCDARRVCWHYAFASLVLNSQHCVCVVRRSILHD